MEAVGGSDRVGSSCSEFSLLRVAAGASAVLAAAGHGSGGGGSSSREVPPECLSGSSTMGRSFLLDRRPSLSAAIQGRGWRLPYFSSSPAKTMHYHPLESPQEHCSPKEAAVLLAYDKVQAYTVRRAKALEELERWMSNHVDLEENRKELRLCFLMEHDEYLGRLIERLLKGYGLTVKKEVTADSLAAFEFEKDTHDEGATASHSAQYSASDFASRVKSTHAENRPLVSTGITLPLPSQMGSSAKPASAKQRPPGEYDDDSTILRDLKKSCDVRGVLEGFSDMYFYILCGVKLDKMHPEQSKVLQRVIKYHNEKLEHIEKLRHEGDQKLTHFMRTRDTSHDAEYYAHLLIQAIRENEKALQFNRALLQENKVKRHKKWSFAPCKSGPQLLVTNSQPRSTCSNEKPGRLVGSTSAATSSATITRPSGTIITTAVP